MEEGLWCLCAIENKLNASGSQLLIAEVIAKKNRPSKNNENKNKRLKDLEELNKKVNEGVYSRLCKGTLLIESQQACVISQVMVAALGMNGHGVEYHWH